MSAPTCVTGDVLRVAQIEIAVIERLLARFGMTLVMVDDGAEIPGSYWGDCEAGLIDERLYARWDTPLHSVLHECSHWITCTPERRAQVHTDAADCEIEETATCWLQIVLADEIPGFGRARALLDMDSWGYSFRLGSATAWFAEDSEDAVKWLRMQSLIDGDGRCSFRVRGTR